MYYLKKGGLSMESYGEFAMLYDQLMYDIDYKQWFDYIEEIFKKYHKNPRNILEMACGTGNLTKYFCDSNYNVTCFDLSEEMLTVAYAKLGAYRNVNILKQDMVDLDLNNKKFDAIIAACDSINYITEDNALLKVFQNAYDHLEEGGIFIFDINSYYKLKNIIGENIFIQDTNDIFYVWDNEFIEDDEICNFYLTFFVKEGDSYNRFDETHRERAYKNRDIVNALYKTGFKGVEIYDSFNFNDVEDESERIFFVALKND